MRVRSVLRIFTAGSSSVEGLIAATLVLCCACFGLAGCGNFFKKPTGGGSGGGGGCTVNCGTASDFLYIANQVATRTGIAGFSISNAALAVAANSPYALTVLPTALAIDPLDKFLYVGSSDGLVYLYAINTDGSLTVQNSGSPVATIAAASMQVDTTGSWLLVANSSNATVSAFAINATTGLLTSPVNGPVTLNAGVGLPSSLVITPANNFAYVSLGTSGVEVLSFASLSGTLADIGHLATRGSQNSDQGMAVDSNSKFLFVTETGVNALRVLSIAASGNVTEVAGSPFTTGLGPSAVLVDSTASFVYVTNRTDNTISQFALTNSGSLIPITGTAPTTGNTPVALVEDKSHTYVAAVSQGGNPDLELFTFDATTAGKLDKFTTIATGTDPTVPVAIAGTR